ncbi:MAG: hypothetical protein KAG97_10450, partial [Victivallales bacterium]|nr:hypothetical protein [Victivallales bacterium]
MKISSTSEKNRPAVSRAVFLFIVAVLFRVEYCEATDFPNTFDAGWTLFTIPCAPSSSDPAVVFAAPFKDVVGISDGKYVLLEDMIEVSAGNAYWAYFENETAVTISGTYLTGGGHDVTLQPGWNMIGSPFDASSWSEATIGGVPVGESSLIESALYYYDAAQDDYVAATNLSQWMGYFIKIGGTEPVTLEVDNSGTGIAGTANLQGLT